MKYRAHLLAIVMALGLAGCTTVGPDYQRPGLDPAIAANWIEPGDPGPVETAWWAHFDDPVLSSLIERLLTDSPDIAEASARLRQARANRDAVVGRALPRVDLTASATENRISEKGQLPVSNIPGYSPEFSLFDIGFDANWEIDFWGRQIRSRQAAEARLESAVEARRDVIVQLTGELARAYVDLRQAQAEARVARGAAGAAAELERLTRLRYEAGESSRIEAAEATTYARAQREAVLRREASARSAAYRIATIIGIAPESILPDLVVDAPIPQAPDTILVGLRSDLLARRPDVRRAERDLAAHVADIGVATADLYPRFSVLGGLGFQSQSLDDLASGETLRFSIGPSFSWPVFSGGRIRAQIRAAGAEADTEAARFERSVAEALSETEDAINGFQAAGRRLQAAREAAAAAETTFRLAESRYRAGEDDRLALERQRLQFLETVRLVVLSEADRASSAATLYKALGGAWVDLDEDELADRTHAPEAPSE
ncbi:MULTISPECIES: efflux transporter outer membrane subunit [Erythrobacteraceae]|uniref:efflux transporter outer membrane subunit n=1 Tax=Erythrobacteraceae TaxID=335929 RepID=UPI0010F7C1D6|nr:efflux transporter outer membrane subunit [Parerythrobacter lutipelagi]